MASAKNPLLSPQREKSGSETKAKYAYQYHWALYRAIQEHSKKTEYAIFMELHEDVVVCDSLEVTKAKFEFNQVKTTKANHTINALIKLKKGKSVLGKLISSVNGKPFASSVIEMNLVATSGFGLTLKDPKLSLDKITIGDIDDADLAKLSAAIKKELSVDPLPTNLQFIIPDLSNLRFKNDLIGEIATLVTDLFPGSNCNAIDIYSLLIGELERKGEVSYDFTMWDDLLRKKALTSVTVTKVINQFTDVKNQAKIQGDFTTIANELKLNFLQTLPLKRGFDRYQQSVLGNKSVQQLDISEDIQNKISSNVSLTGDNVEVLLDSVYESLEGKTKSSFPTKTDARAAIMFELILNK